MPDKNDQERARQEDLMARGPVSRGASNEDAPFDKRQHHKVPQDAPDRRTRKREDYDKMLHDRSGGTPEEGGRGSEHVPTTERAPGTVGGGTLSDRGDTGSGKARGGRLTSNSTVGGGASSPGTVVGQGEPRARGEVSETDLNQTTDTADMLNRRTKSAPRHPQTSSGDRPEGKHKHQE